MLPLALASLSLAQSGATPESGALSSALAAVIAVVEDAQAAVGGAADPCLVVTPVAARTWELDYDACVDSGLSGSVVVDRSVAGQVTLTFADDFAYAGDAIAGQVVLSRLAKVAWELTAADLTVTDGTTGDSSVLGLALTLAWPKGEAAVLAWGAGDVVTTSGGEVTEATLDVGAAGAAPLTWALPLAGALPTAGELAISTSVLQAWALVVDLDDYVRPGDGTDDYAAQEVPVEAYVSGTFLVVFGPTCADVTLDFSASEDVVVTAAVEVQGSVRDIEVVVPAAEVEAAVDASLAAVDLCAAP